MSDHEVVAVKRETKAVRGATSGADNAVAAAIPATAAMPAAMPAADANTAAADTSLQRMNAALRRKLSLLRDMQSYSEQAGTFIDEDNVEQLGNVFIEKQGLIEEIDYLDRQFLSDFDGFKSDLGICSLDEIYGPDSVRFGGLRERNAAGLRDLRAYTSEILGLARKIESLESGVNKRIKKLRDDLTADLARIRRQKQVSGFYAGDGAQPQSRRNAELPTHPKFDSKK